MPKTWTDEQKAKACEEILTQVATGKSLRAICGRGDEWIPPEATFRGWVDNDLDLAAQYTRARADRADAIFEECLVIADKQGADVETVDGVETVNHNVIQRARLQIDTRRWFLSKMQPKKYGEKLAIGGAEDLPPIQTIDPARISTEALREIMAAVNETDER